MKTEKAIKVLRDYNLWRRGDEEMEQPDPWRIGEAIDDVLMAIENMEEEAKLHRGAITGWQNKWKCVVDSASYAKAERDEAIADVEHLKEQLDYTRKQRDKMVDDLDQLVLTVSDIRDARGMV